MTLPTDYILGLILTVGADAYRCMPSLKADDGEPIVYPEIAYAITSTCDALCKEIAGAEMGDTPHDSRELVIGIIQKTFEDMVEHMERDQNMDINSIPTIKRDLYIDEIEVSDDEER
ncbi:hypothetical protein [Collinsella sp. LCP19S3_B11]|uniref:hypothetical protein n=1 Tax=Collinsella sp. LCP19S3_B11 TaxID=3438754 RepID=UPI003F936273